MALQIITHPDKIFWPKEKISKSELAEYYERISPVLLPYLKDRPESLLRHPNGIRQKGFFQKDLANDHPSFVKTAVIRNETDNRQVHYVICNNLDTLLYMVNLGCIELNSWSSRIKKLDYPDFAILDLDPEKIGFGAVVQTALVVHAILGKFGIPNHCKTSGKTGLHICIPLRAKYRYDRIRDFCHRIAIQVNQKLSNFTSLERDPKKRHGKVYIDFLQNKIGSTIACAYSVRPYPGGTVSAPLKWSEVNQKLDPSQFTLQTMLARLKKVGDLWKPILGKGAVLPHLLGH